MDAWKRPERVQRRVLTRRYTRVDPSSDTAPVMHAMQMDDTLLDEGVPQARGLDTSFRDFLLYIFRHKWKAETYPICSRFLNTIALNEKLYETRLPMSHRTLCIGSFTFLLLSLPSLTKKN